MAPSSSSPSSSLAFPAPNALTPALESELSEMLGKIYRACRANDHDHAGTPYMAWDADLRARNFAIRTTPDAAPERLLRFVSISHMNEHRNVVGTQFRFDLASRSETYFVLGEIKFTGLQLYLTGNEFERAFPPNTMPVAKEEWDQWGRGLSEPVYRRYVDVIYPKVTEVVGAICARRSGAPAIVFDLGGGSGSLAEAICANVDAVGKLVLVEQSDVLLEEARVRAAKHSERLVIEKGDLTAEGALDALSDAPDVVILSGVVAQQVLEHAQGLGIMRRVHRKLAKGGFGLVPSYSPALLTARDYEAMGFIVHNKTLSVIEESASDAGRSLQTNDFYVLEKS